MHSDRALVEHPLRRGMLGGGLGPITAARPHDSQGDFFVRARPASKTLIDVGPVELSLTRLDAAPIDRMQSTDDVRIGRRGDVIALRIRGEKKQSGRLVCRTFARARGIRFLLRLLGKIFLCEYAVAVAIEAVKKGWWAFEFVARHPAVAVGVLASEDGPKRDGGPWNRLSRLAVRLRPRRRGTARARDGLHFGAANSFEVPVEKLIDRLVHVRATDADPVASTFDSVKANWEFGGFQSIEEQLTLMVRDGGVLIAMNDQQGWFVAIDISDRICPIGLGLVLLNGAADQSGFGRLRRVVLERGAGWSVGIHLQQIGRAEEIAHGLNAARLVEVIAGVKFLHLTARSQ